MSVPSSGVTLSRCPTLRNISEDDGIQLEDAGVNGGTYEVGCGNWTTGVST